MVTTHCPDPRRVEGLAETGLQASPIEDPGELAFTMIVKQTAPLSGQGEDPQAPSNKLLDQLLYCGKLPRYAFPTDVATFHVFDREHSTPFRPIMRFAPQQSLPVALTQYAPDKQVWISGKCFRSGAIYSVDNAGRYKAWQSRRIYMECSECGFARTFPITTDSRNEKWDCEACGAKETFGPGRNWIRPPGFAHPIDVEEKTSSEGIPETSYATRAKLTMGTPGDDSDWRIVNNRVRILPLREHLLVSNTGPRKGGYTYCTNCGRIEASKKPSRTLFGSHSKPFPAKRSSQECEGSKITHVVLGTDFITDIALLSLRVARHVDLTPVHTSTIVALRTVSEALAIAACRLLEIEHREIVAEFRPALTPDGKTGDEAEIFLYDTLPGGAGFSRQLADQGIELLEQTLRLMENCPENCDSSCYRCLRSFKNKFEHALLDRHVGAGLVRHLLTGEDPETSQSRIRSLTTLLYSDLKRQSLKQVKFRKDVAVSLRNKNITVPILAETVSGQKFIVALSGALTPRRVADPKLAILPGRNGPIQTILQNELLIRSNLPTATRSVLDKIDAWDALHGMGT